jgi:hypothetical protein
VCDRVLADSWFLVQQFYWMLVYGPRWQTRFTDLVLHTVCACFCKDWGFILGTVHWRYKCRTAADLEYLNSSEFLLLLFLFSFPF